MKESLDPDDNARWKFLVDAIPALVSYIDSDFYYRFCNQAYCDWFSVSKAEVEDHHMIDVLGAESFSRLRPYLERCLAGEPVRFEAQIPYKTGGTRWIDGQYAPDTAPDGKVKGCIVLVNDVTERKQRELSAEDALRDRERKLTAIIDNSPAVLYLKDIEGRFTLVNPNVSRLVGLPPDQIIGKTDFDLFPREIAIDLRQDDLKVFDTNSRLVFEETMIGKDGSHQHFLSHKFPVLNAQGEARFLCGISLNVTERKKSEKELQQKIEAIENSLNGFDIVNDEGKFIYVNRAYVEMWGYSSAEEIIGTSPAAHCADPETPNEIIGRLKSDGRCDIEFVAKRKDGSTFDVRMLAFLAHDAEGREIYPTTCIDVTEQKRAAENLRKAKEEAERANHSKTAFLANMSHEIRTPMTAVLGFTELLRDRELPEKERQDALARIDRSGRGLLKLIDDILDVAKVESGKIAIEKTRFSPLEVVAEVTSLLRLQAEQKGIDLKTRLLPSVPEIAYSDPTRLRQILTNLIGNAIKFTKQGTVIVEVSAESDQRRQSLVFSISDTGIGISEKDQSKLFQPFAQADDSITRQFGGTGLGLVLSRRLAQQLGGDLVLARSQLNEGSSFIAKVEAGPFDSFSPHEIEISDEARTEAKPDLEKAALHSARILVVDDVEDNQFLMRRYLEAAGAHVDVASDGEEAISKAMGRRYDVVLMDIQMPHVDGIQATKRLRKQGYGRPILAMTAHAMKEEKDRSLDAGCDEHLTKPVTKNVLVSAVSKYVRKPSRDASW